MPIYDSVDGVARKVAKIYDEVDGVARSVTKVYDCVDGVARMSFSGEVKWKEYACLFKYLHSPQSTNKDTGLNILNFNHDNLNINVPYPDEFGGYYEYDETVGYKVTRPIERPLITESTTKEDLAVLVGQYHVSHHYMDSYNTRYGSNVYRIRSIKDVYMETYTDNYGIEKTRAVVYLDTIQYGVLTITGYEFAKQGYLATRVEPYGQIPGTSWWGNSIELMEGSIEEGYCVVRISGNNFRYYELEE